ncbi:CACTA en-spm transposon protein [Cucumis melo var. makuwa]|uniref:CACTA en-spm transposon protein n=1 Tax=Cucumis melo var. makuwa TaxID=1194695 RepID=A0A5A7V6W5_CUCMM|nr:CACTA en-spm transposon protein [Cucumis melo var. makuwa]
MGGSSSVNDNSELECYVATKGQISMMITRGTEKPIFPHVVRFSQAIGCVWKRHFLTAALSGRTFVEHQMLSTFKEFRADCHRHFKNYSDLEEARTNPPYLLLKLAEQKEETVDRVELFRQTHIRDGTFVSQAAEDVHNQILKLESQPTSEGTQPLFGKEIFETVLGRRPSYLKGFGWGPKPKARRMGSASSTTTSYL